MSYYSSQSLEIPGIRHVRKTQSFKKPAQPTPYASFGQDFSQHKHAPVAPPKSVHYPHQEPQHEPQIPVNRAPAAPVQQDTPYRPSWTGTLKSGSGAKPWDTDVDYSHYSQPDYQAPSAPAHPPQHTSHQSFTPSHAPEASTGGSDSGPKVVHLQYNSPMDMYSQQNINETLEGQIQG